VSVAADRQGLTNVVYATHHVVPAEPAAYRVMDPVGGRLSIKHGRAEDVGGGVLGDGPDGPAVHPIAVAVSTTRRICLTSPTRPCTWHARCCTRKGRGPG
jgi:hypothetical protein